MLERKYRDFIMIKTWIAACLMISALAGSAAAQGVAIEGPWARATAGQAKNGAAYLTLTNLGDTPERLVKVESPVATTVELHAHVNDNGVMRMRAITAIEVSPGEPSILQPGGLHVMLIDLKEPLKQGEKFPLTLTFESGKTATVQVAIRQSGAVGAGAAAPRSAHGNHTPPAKPTK